MKEKNLYVDAIRGIAMLLVILGHTITGCTEGYESSILYNIIWSLQMPLFFIISGYITKYNKPLTQKRTFLKALVRRSCALLVPYVVWTFVVRGLFYGESSFFDLKHLIFHLDTGYWFLFSLWTISVISMLSRYIACRISDNKIRSTLLTLVFMAMFSFILLVVGLTAGMSFLNIKQTVYYIPFFVIGYLYGIFQDEIEACAGAINIAVALSTVLWVYVLLNCSIVNLGEDILSIAVRFLSSVCGCISVFGLLQKLIKGAAAVSLQYIGSHTLEIYLIHYLFLRIIPSRYPVNTLESLVLVSVNFALTLGLTVVSFILLHQSRILRKVLFFKD